MHSELSTEELARDWSLSFADLDFLNTKPKATRYVLAAQLKYFTAHGCFAYDIPAEAVSYLAEQLGNKLPDLTEVKSACWSILRLRQCLSPTVVCQM